MAGGMVCWRLLHVREDTKILHDVATRPALNSSREDTIVPIAIDDLSFIHVLADRVYSMYV